MSSTTIELNGNRYDARTGKIVDGIKAQPTKTTVALKSNGMVIDGFMKRKIPTIESAGVHVIPKSNETGKIAPSHAIRKTQKSQTLMRPAVTKPVIKNDIQSKRPTSHTRSPLIHRFAPPATSGVTKKHASIPVASPAKSTTVQARTPQSHAPTKSPDHFQSALHGATAHLQQFDDSMFKKKSALSRMGFKNKLANVTALSLSALLLVGFFAYQNAPAVEMRVAATRAGVSASMPGYKPAGYGVASVKTNPGKVSLSFRSRTDNKGFTLTQQASNWNSASLLANTVAQNNQPYQTYQDEGKTVYIYNNSNATWVDGGVWYQVEGDASLTSDQLLRLANSL